jgi:putative ABC transport system permease protein
MSGAARAVGLALRSFAREWRAGELAVLLLALTVAVAALTGVGFLVDRIGIAVDRQATEVLAADLRLESPRPIAEEDFRQAARRGLRCAHTVSMLSVVFLGDRSELSDLHGVSEGYPLRGTLKVASEPFGAGTAAGTIPGRGEVWPSSRLLATLGGHVGSVLSIGAARFRVTRVLISRPGEGGTFEDLAPAVLLNAADLPATKLIEPGSRVRYAALFAGAREPIEAFRGWLAAHRGPGERLRDIAEASPQIKSAVDRAGRFLELASLVSVLLCAIAVAMAARQYVRRHLDAVALMKTLGATRALTMSVSLIELLLLAVTAAAIGSAVGFLAQEWLLHAVRGLISTRLPPPDLFPVGMGFLAAIAVLAGFALPPLLQLSRVPPLRVLRRDVGPPPTLLLLAFGPAAAAMAALVYWAVRDMRLFVEFVVGLGVFGLALAACGFGLVLAAGRLRGRVGVAWRYGIANLSRRRADSVVQIVSFGAGIMVLLLLGVVRRDLVSDWQRTLPTDAPNYFFINIPADDRADFVEFLTSRGARLTRVLPMMRGRLTAIDGHPVEALRFRGPAGRRFADREQNLTWSASLAAGNRVVAGRWWTREQFGEPLVSLSTEIAQALGVGVGTRLTFTVGGETVTATVGNVRKVKWDSFQPNFFIVFVPGLLDGVAGTYLTSAYFRAAHGGALAELVHRFPSVSIFDVDGLLEQARSLMDKAILAVESVFGFTLFAGLTVLLAAVQASRDERRFESAMLRALGASTRTVLAGVLAEFTTVGLLAGLLAAGGASLAGAFVASRVLQVPYAPDPWVFVVGMVGGAALVATGGWLATRSAITQPPLGSLRAG